MLFDDTDKNEVATAPSAGGNGTCSTATNHGLLIKSRQRAPISQGDVHVQAGFHAHLVGWLKNQGPISNQCPRMDAVDLYYIASSGVYN